jgi:hypothetical protein
MHQFRQPLKNKDEILEIVSKLLSGIGNLNDEDKLFLEQKQVSPTLSLMSKDLTIHLPSF